MIFQVANGGCSEEEQSNQPKIEVIFVQDKPDLVVVDSTKVEEQESSCKNN